MKLVVTDYVYEPPSIAILPETEYEAAVLRRYWDNGAVLEKGKARSQDGSFNGYAYGIKFKESGQKREGEA